MKVLAVLHTDNLQGVTTFNYTLLEAIKQQVSGDNLLYIKILEPQASGFKNEFTSLGANDYTNEIEFDLILINNRPGLEWVVENQITSERFIYFTHSLPNEDQLQKVVLPPAATSLPYVLEGKLEVVVFSEVAQNYLNGLGHATILARNAINLERFQENESPTKIEKLLVFDVRNNLLYKSKVQNLTEVIPNTYLRTISSPKWSIEAEIEAADMVIAYGRCAIESMAMGKAVIIYGQNGGDGLVTDANKEKLGETNYSGYSIRNMPSPEYLSELDILAHIMNYDATDAQKVQEYIRENYSTQKLLEVLSLIEIET